MSGAILDREQRARALDPARSFIVQAPAGSGKTELLVQRYLRLLPAVERPEEILAITFTRKAAAEMKRRVVEGLPGAAELAPRLRIQTFDALCASFTRQMPVLARFGAQPEIVEDARELYREAAARTLALLESRDPAAEHVARLLAHLDGNAASAASLVAGMLAKRDQWLRKAHGPLDRAHLEAALAAERERVVARARTLLPEASEELARELLTKQRAWRKRNTRAQELADNEPARRALAALLDVLPAAYSDGQWEALGAIVHLLPRAVAELKLVCAERGQADFTEIAQGAVRALGDPGEPTDLLLSLDVRIRHVLVDEFQDTSISQWELLERLTAGWEPDDGRTVFAVGDPMQSIYRFREAQVGLFLRARHRGLGGVKLEALTLSTNFRSQAGIVEWVNSAFARILPAQEDFAAGAVPYAPSTPHAPRQPGEAVSWHLFGDRAQEAQRVVELVQGAQGKCAVLVRNRSALEEIVPALKAAGLRFRAIEIERLGEKQVVQDLYALTRALNHLADRIAWLAVLRAPWCGLSLADLARLFEGKLEPTVWELMQDAPELERVRGVLAPALANRLRGSLRERVEGAWLALGGPACVEDATELEDAEVFLDQLEALEEAGDLADHGRLDEALAELYALPDVEADERLQIMTIHKAKGLEFDTVILPGLDRAPGRGTPPLFIWKETADERLLLAPIKETGGPDELAYDYLKDLDQQAEDTEAGRLLYVAATRAVTRLHLLGCLKQDADADPKPPPKRSLLAQAWTIAPRAIAPAPAHVLAPKPAGAAPDELHRLRAGFRLPPPPACAVWNPPPEARDQGEQIEFSWAGETARHVGSVVHRWLQRIAEDGLRGWDAKRVDSLRAQFGRELERRGVHPRDRDASAELVALALANTLGDERGRWIVGPHAEAHSEYRIRARIEGSIRSYVIDRVFRDQAGARWIVDYKTSRHEGADIEAFLDREVERYAGQLRGYAAALAGSRQGLYFPLLRSWRASGL
ncbi:MAG TPA: UvrD-helicase domain-containing protein [Burkholderiales bacterium]|nr:UvrD-helicase domain-containing protein [Burkholderiales bacterium]